MKRLMNKVLSKNKQYNTNTRKGTKNEQYKRKFSNSEIPALKDVKKKSLKSFRKNGEMCIKTNVEEKCRTC